MAGREGHRVTEALAGVGRSTIEVLRALGHHAFFLLELLKALPAALRRPYLVVAQIHAVGNRSLVLILASGLAVGFVLALQMYYALVTYGAAESLGLIVNLSLTRELGPVVTALLFAGRAGTSLTAEIGLMKAGEQLAEAELAGIEHDLDRLGMRAVAAIGGVRHVAARVAHACRDHAVHAADEVLHAPEAAAGKYGALVVKFAAHLISFRWSMYAP